MLGHHQVKLFSSLNLATGSPEDNFINFGHDHDYKFGSQMMSSLPTNAVGVMDRGFAYLILQILSIPQQWGHTLLDKFRYLQSCMCQKISYVHWFEEMMSC